MRETISPSKNYVIQKYTPLYEQTPHTKKPDRVVLSPDVTFLKLTYYILRQHVYEYVVDANRSTNIYNGIRVHTLRYVLYLS